MLAELPRFLAATHASTLQEQDTAQVCQALLAALPGEGTLPQPLLNSPGIKTWYSTLRRAQPQLSAAQQLQVLECLAAMVRAGCGELMEVGGMLCWVRDAAWSWGLQSAGASIHWTGQAQQAWPVGTGACMQAQHSASA